MVLIERGKRRGKKSEDNRPSSFRFDDETKRRLEVLGLYANKKQTVILEDLIDRAYEEVESRDPDELKKSERLRRELKKQD